MFKKFKKYLINKFEPGNPYLNYYFCTHFGKNGYVPTPFWDWHFILYTIIPGKVFHYIEKIYILYVNYWAKKNDLIYDPFNAHSNIEINPRYQKEYDYYKK